MRPRPIIRTLLSSVGALFMLIGCPSQPPAQVTVPAVDATPPSGLWLQIEIPGKPLLNAYPGTPATASLVDDAHIRATARADDPDGGVRETRIWMTYSRSRPGTIQNPGLAGAPVASSTSTANVGDATDVVRSTSYEFDLQALKQDFDTLNIDIWAEAENFHSGVSTTSHITLNVSWHDLRLLVIPLSDSDGVGHAPNVTATEFSELVTRVNRSFVGTGIRLVFDASNDWAPMNDDELNRDGTNMGTRANAIAANNPGRIVCLLRWGGDLANSTGNGNAFPPGTGNPPLGVTDVVQNYVALPNQITATAFLNFGDGSFVAHEFGHYLGLYHTFNGWTDRLGPIYGSVPATTSLTQLLADQKVVDWIAANGGTVAALDGDRLVDTPPDPAPVLFAAHSQNVCEQPTITVTGQVGSDAMSYSLTPDPGNVMGYFANCIPLGSPAGTLPPPQRFTSQQIAKMNSTLQGPARSHLID